MTSGIVLLKARAFHKTCEDILIKKAMRSLLKSTLWNACKWLLVLNLHQLNDHASELVNERAQPNEFEAVSVSQISRASRPQDSLSNP